MEVMDRVEREPCRQFDNCNWTLKYGRRQELIFYDMPEQIKPRTPAHEEQRFNLCGLFKIAGRRQSDFRR